ncbi:MAG: protein translocase subunit SecF [Firmicutes bacterium]|nr:protein translocase subunit SecF [Bacillota bacterium]
MYTKIKNFVFKDWKYSRALPIASIISGAVFAIGLIILIVLGFNLGLEFTGGKQINLTLANFDNRHAGQNGAYHRAIEDALQSEDLTYSRFQVDTTNGILIITFQSDRNVNELTEILLPSNGMGAIFDALYAAGLVTDVSDIVVHESSLSYIGPEQSRRMVQFSILAIALATLLMLIYVAIRFQFLSGVAAILGLLHDVGIMVALVLIFRIEINTAFIAALITIIGYSLNNTIVVFDRIRENRKKASLQKASPDVIVNKSVRQSMGRIIATSFTTMIVILLVGLIGVPQVRMFAMPIFFGLVAGTFSTLFIVSPVWAKLVKKLGNVKIFKAKEKEESVEEGEGSMDTGLLQPAHMSNTKLDKHKPKQKASYKKSAAAKRKKQKSKDDKWLV